MGGGSFCWRVLKQRVKHGAHKSREVMDIQKTKTVTFPKASFETWEQKAEQALKGKSLSVLNTATPEGIELKPLYTLDQLTPNTELPGVAPYTRGTNALGYKEKPWLFAQPVAGNSAQEILAHLEEAVNRGQNAVSLHVGQLLVLEEKELTQVLEATAQKGLPLFVDTQGAQKALLSKLALLSDDLKEQLSGVLAEDPILEGASKGKAIENEQSYIDAWLKNINEIGSVFPNLKTILIKATTVHNAGGNHVQELAMALAVASEYLHKGIESGLSVDKLAKQFAFSFSVDSSFFMNVAKLRAARRLWSLLGQAFTEDASIFKMYIHTETSSFTETLFDQYVNLLRTGNQAFASVVGGAQSIQIAPFDHVTNKVTPFSERIARNIHLVLKEETLIDQVVDPAGGSFYIETLTDEVADAAWKLFLEIEGKGGAIQVLQEGSFQESVSATLEQKKQRIATRQDSLIGTNVYPNLEDRVELIVQNDMEIELPYETKTIAPLSKARLAEEFEVLRLASLDYQAKKGAFPTVGLICIGELKNYKPRADFMKGFLAAGGIQTVEQQCLSVEEAIAFIEQSQQKHYVLCGSDADYSEYAVNWTEKISASYSDTNLLMAGKQAAELEQQLKDAGMNDFVSAKSNVVTVLTAILKDLGVL